MPYPALSYSPTQKFAFKRSYAAQIVVSGQSNDVEFVGGTITQWIDRSIGYGIVYKILPAFVAWSSNRYTLDYIVDDVWWFAFFDGIHHPQDYRIAFATMGMPYRPSVWIVDPASTAFSVTLPLSPAPPSYWVPPYPV